MKKALFAMIGLWSVFLLMGCSTEVESKEKGQGIKGMVHKYSTGSFDNISASITSHKLIVMGDQEKSYDLPEEEFFVSIAPYVNETHPCEIHSLTGCQGELDNKDFNVYIQDEDGKVIIDETMTSLENGFIDLWLPREKTYQVRINYGEKTSETTISTFKDDNTCITTMQLI